MKLALIGTSNAILKSGYSAALAESTEITDFWRGSFGKSSPLVFSIFSRELEERHDDVVIIELCVNAAIMLGSKEDVRFLAEDTPQNVHSAFCDLIERCLIRNKFPVFVVWPCLQVLNYPEAPIFKIIKKVLDRYAIAWFDGYSLLQRMMRASDSSDPKKFFLDKAHISAPFAYKIGEFLPPLIVKARTLSEKSTKISTYGKNNTVVPLSPIAPPNQTVSRSTSIMKMDFLRIFSNESIEVVVPSESEVVGICFDAARSHGLLEIEGMEVRHYLLDNVEWKDSDSASTRLFTMPIRNPMAARECAFHITLKSGRAIVNDPPELQWPQPNPTIEPLATLYGLVVRHPVPPVEVKRPYSAPLELTQFIDDAAVGDIISVTQN